MRLEDFATELNFCLSDVVNEEIAKNGFRACGLYPFSQDNVDYTKLLTQLKPQSENAPPESATGTNGEATLHNTRSAKQLLTEIETRLDPQTLIEFQLNQYEIWTGPKSDESLFYFWRKILQESRSPEEINEHDVTLDANLPNLELSENDLSVDCINIDDQTWQENQNVLNLEVQADGSILLLTKNTKFPSSDYSRRYS